MIRRHVFAAAAALAMLGTALAQDNPAPSRIAMPATGAYPVRQDSTQVLGSNLIGAKVVSITNETIGRVSNLVVNENGAVDAAVISVGGLFGHKEVAVTFKSLIIARTKTGDAIDHVILAASKDDLRQAAEFKPLSQQLIEQQAALKR
ncbi:MAG: PRC-barrel domain-containing protein [Alphaproteobacteria bacterium]